MASQIKKLVEASLVTGKPVRLQTVRNKLAFGGLMKDDWQLEDHACNPVAYVATQEAGFKLASKVFDKAWQVYEPC